MHALQSSSTKSKFSLQLLSLSKMQRQIVSTPRRKSEESAETLPLYYRRSGNPNRVMLGSRLLIHLIPVILLLCIIILWCFSYPVTLEIRNERIMAIHRVDMLGNLNETRVDLTILVVKLPPYPSIRLVHTWNNDTVASEPAVSIITE